MQYSDIIKDYHIITKLKRNDKPILFCRKKDNTQILFLTEKNFEYVPVDQQTSNELMKIYAPKPTGIFPVKFSNNFKTSHQYKSYIPNIELSLNIVRSFIKSIFKENSEPYLKKLDLITFETPKDNPNEKINVVAYTARDYDPYTSKIVIKQPDIPLSQSCLIFVHEILHAVAFDPHDPFRTGFVGVDISLNGQNDFIGIQNDCNAINEAYTQYLAERLVKSAHKKGLITNYHPVKIDYDFHQNLLEILMDFANQDQKNLIRLAYFKNNTDSFKKVMCEVLHLNNSEKLDLLFYQMDALLRIQNHTINEETIYPVKQDAKFITTSILNNFFDLCHTKVQILKQQDPTITFNQIFNFTKANENKNFMSLIGQKVDSLSLKHAAISQLVDINSLRIKNELFDIQDLVLKGEYIKIKDECHSVNFFVNLLGQNGFRVVNSEVLTKDNYKTIAKNIFQNHSFYLSDDLNVKYEFMQDIINNASQFNFDIVSCFDIKTLCYLCVNNPKNLLKIYSQNKSKATTILKTLPTDENTVISFINNTLHHPELNKLEIDTILTKYIDILPNDIIKTPKIYQFLANVIKQQMNQENEEITK